MFNPSKLFCPAGIAGELGISQVVSPYSALGCFHLVILSCMKILKQHLLPGLEELGSSRYLVAAFNSSCSVPRLNALTKFQIPCGCCSRWTTGDLGFTWLQPQGSWAKTDITYCAGSKLQTENISNTRPLLVFLQEADFIARLVHAALILVPVTLAACYLPSPFLVGTVGPNSFK
jgi:hypothetical protein